jgi:DNA topoisomerase-1
VTRFKTDLSVRAAEAAGLRYVTDFGPGIRRTRAGKGFRYLDPRDRVIRDPERLARFRALAVPPAWSDVWICPHPDGHIQVTARDAKGRKQYRYHPRYRAARDGTKFDRMLEFSEALPLLRKRVERDLCARGLPRRKVLATCVRLLEKTLIRVGNPRYTRENRSYGLTTLRRRHVTVTGSRIRFEFRGKSGVHRSVSLEDPALARTVQRCRMTGGEQLLRYLNPEGTFQEVRAADINAYLRQVTGRLVTAKDFRTWAGTMFAAAALRDIGIAPGPARARKYIVKAIDQVAERLGNTRSVCLKYYVHPAVVEAYEEGHVVSAPPTPEGGRYGGPPAALRRNEADVLQLIHRHLERRRGSPPPDPAAGKSNGSQRKRARSRRRLAVTS